jgi:ATP-dependent helicase HepA
MLEAATARAEAQAQTLKAAAGARATAALGAELQRLVDLQRINDHVRPEEIELAREQLARTGTAIAEARLRLDSIRLVVEGPQALS